jgi:hypothetical protein
MKKGYLVLSAFASLALFSSISSSTVYYSSPQVCAAVNQDQAFSFEWRENGIFNRDETKSLWMVCPTTRGVSDSKNARYDVGLRVHNQAEASTDITCVMREISNNSGIAQSQVRTLSVDANRTSAMKWQRVKPLAPKGESSFTLTCKLPPNTGLGNISIEAR